MEAALPARKTQASDADAGNVGEAMRRFRGASNEAERRAAALEAGRAAMDAWDIEPVGRARRLGYDDVRTDANAYLGQDGVVYLTKRAFTTSPNAGTPGRFGATLAHEFEAHGAQGWATTKQEQWAHEVEAHGYNLRRDQLARFGLTNDREYIGAKVALVNAYKSRLGWPLE